MQVLDYVSPAYNGKALRLGAGVQGYEAIAFAHSNGLVVVTGNCPTVGVAGGYTQGGGHGSLASKFGMGADQVLEWEVVTSSGQRLVATPTLNQDLYWALSGGGGGTYAAVLSITVRAHPDLPTSAANLTFTADECGYDTFYDTVATFIETVPALVDNNATVIFLVAPGLFYLQPVTAPGISASKLDQLLSPIIRKLQANGMNYSTSHSAVEIGVCLYN